MYHINIDKKGGDKVPKSRLKVHRVLRDMTQEELASKAGISVKTIGLYEKDINALRSASYNNLLKISKALNIKVDEIFLG